MIIFQWDWPKHRKIMAEIVGCFFFYEFHCDQFVIAINTSVICAPYRQNERHKILQHEMSVSKLAKIIYISLRDEIGFQ